MKTYEQRIRLIDQHMYAAWRYGVDRRTFKAMCDFAVTATQAIEGALRSIAESARNLMPVIEAAQREIAAQDAIARRQEFEA